VVTVIELHFVPDGSLSASDCKGLADVLASVGDNWTIMAVGPFQQGLALQ